MMNAAVPSRQRARFLRRQADVVTFDPRLEPAQRLQHLPQRAEMIRRRGRDDDQLGRHRCGHHRQWQRFMADSGPRQTVALGDNRAGLKKEHQ